MAVEAHSGGVGDEYLFMGDAEEGILDVAQKHGARKKQLEELFGSFAKQGHAVDIEDMISAINFRASGVARSWRDFVCQIGSDTGSYINGEFISSVATVWMQDEQERADLFNSITDSDLFKPVCKGDILKLKIRIEETIRDFTVDPDSDTDWGDQLAEELAGEYSGYMEMDVEEFLEVFQGSLRSQDLSGEATRIARIKELLPRLGAHALDVAKLAGGVSLGIIIGSMLRKK